MGRQSTTLAHTVTGDFQGAKVIGKGSLAKWLEGRFVFERFSLDFIRLSLGQCLNAVFLSFSEVIGAHLRGFFR